MFSSLRLEEIFQIICNQPYTKINELSKHFQVTERTIRTDISTLNMELEKYNCDIQLKRKYGYFIHIGNETAFQFLLSQCNSECKEVELNSLNDRIHYILKQLLYSEEYINLDDLADSVFVSRNTLQNYIKTIKEILESHNLMYVTKPNKGVKVFGNEKDKRECLINNILSKEAPSYIISFSKKEQQLFNGIDLNLLNSIIIHNLNHYKIKSSDYDRKNLVIHFALMLSRAKTENYIPYDATFPIPKEVQDMINKMCKDVEAEFDVQITNGEKQYIYLHIATNTALHIGTINPILLERQIKDLLDTIYQEYNFDLRNDEILQKDLFNHFSSIFTSRNISLHKKNPLLNTIKTNFPLAFEITLTTTSKIFSEVLNEDEIGYVSLHIGAAIERCFSGQYNHKQVLLMCGSGIATTRMLEARLNAFFHNKITIKDKVSYAEFQSYTLEDLKEIDFVISTIPIQSDMIPIEVVDFALNNSDIEKISRLLSSINKQLDKTKNFFDKNLFIHRKKANSKEEIIQLLCHLLENQNIVNGDYFDSVMQREALAKTNMNNLFAIPHPMKPCCNQTKVAVAILDEPIEWNQEKETVQIVFMLSLRADEQRDIEHLYDLFIEIVNNTKLQHQIIKSQNFDEFIKIISRSVE